MYTQSYNRKNRMLTVVILLASLSCNLSCRKYVDIKKTSDQDNIESASDCQLLLDNYGVMNTSNPSDGEVSADDYYLSRTSYLGSTMNDEHRGIYSWAPSAIHVLAAPQWQSPYQVVYVANLVLENVEKLRGTEDNNQLNQLRGAALFYRAYTFWQIAQLYAMPFNTSGVNSDPGIPMRLSSDISERSDRETVQVTYDRIIKDLNEALSLLPATSSVSSRPNKISANAMLARVYLSMENYPQALIFANQALAGNNQLIDYNTISKSSPTPFDRFNKEVIYQSLMIVSPALVPGSASNNTAKIDRDLYASYTNNDLRKSIFFKPNTITVALPTGGNTTVSDSTYRFSGNYEPATNGALFDGLAVDEIYLIRAECHSRTNNVSAALSDLNTVLKNRYINTPANPFVNFTVNTAEEALSLILTERRKELLMRGLRWSDLRRLNRDERFRKNLVRTTLDINAIVTGTSAPFSIKISYTPYRTDNLLANDLKYNLLIPNEVILNTSMPQNAR